MPAVYNAFDISSVTSAFGEGVPNALGEAMCCEIPSVTTDVGDAAYLRSDPEWVVPVGDAEGVAARWRVLLAMSPEERAEIGKASRARIISECTPEKLAQLTEEAFLRLMTR
jgi:glycosyltransferase involved in cell wall biosynthesis